MGVSFNIHLKMLCLVMGVSPHTVVIMHGGGVACVCIKCYAETDDGGWLVLSDGQLYLDQSRTEKKNV